MSTGFKLGALEITDAATSRTNLGLGTASTISYLVSTWTPTLVGASTAGTTTYVTQTGNYVQIGNIVVATGLIQISAATGTGIAQISLPVTVSSLTSSRGAVIVNGTGWAWPALTTNTIIVGTANTTTATVNCTGNGVASSALQMTNAAVTISFTLVYQV